MAIKVKSGVVFKEINAPLFNIIKTLLDAEFEIGKEMVITSVNDSVHKKNSLHYQNRAIDIRTKHLTPEEKKKLYAFLRNKLGGDYDVILESEGLDNEHIHIEYDPKFPSFGSK
jgi:hypothetical protein